jgi:predicted deacetylase
MRRLLASIHDVSPRFENEVDRLLELVTPHVGQRIALLVVPNHWGDAPIGAGSRFARRLRDWADSGFEIFLHGYYHRDGARHAGPADRMRAHWLTAGEGEFLGLAQAEARTRIERGRTLVESITGRPIAGFIAPAWLYGEGALQALRECAVPLAEDHLRVWSPATGRLLSRSPVITWASRTPARLRASLLAAALLRTLPMRDLRIGVHPGDCCSERLLESIQTTFRIVARSRRPSAYSELAG